MKSWEWDELRNSYDKENPGKAMVGFEYSAPANYKGSFEVLLIPRDALTLPGLQAVTWRSGDLQ